MNAYKVEVYRGGGGDRDEVGTYLCWAMNEALAVQLALNHATLSLSAEAEEIELVAFVDEADYDAVLGSPPEKGE